MSIVGSDDPASDAVDETFAKCKHSISTILVSLTCPTCDKASKVSSQLGLLLHLLSQEPAAQSVAKDLRQFLLRARGGKEKASLPEREIPILDGPTLMPRNTLQ